MVDELNTVLQEINVGKTRRDAIKDLASRYELPDLSTFARTLIQADKMGTSVTEALNILSEDMRLARYRRGETLALKAPMKMLVPLLVLYLSRRRHPCRRPHSPGFRGEQSLQEPRRRLSRGLNRGDVK